MTIGLPRDLPSEQTGQGLDSGRNPPPRLELAHRRLHNQRLSETTFTQPADVVKWLGAIQSQDYAGAKWAIGQRTRGLTDAAIDQALARGTILRTHVMRPTWHFVAPDDIRWLLELTGPRVRAASAYQMRRLELDQATFTQSNAALRDALQGGRQCTRSELAGVLERAGIPAARLRLVYLLMNAELDGIICSGARRGRQFTYALFDDRVPAAKPLDRDEALAELARRYFTGHGPATEKDFAWWSGLTAMDVRNGLELAKSDLHHLVLDGKTYWFGASTPATEGMVPTAYLLPNFDEYLVGYGDRSAIWDPSHTDKLDSRQSPLAQHTIIVDGQIAGTWKRTLKKDAVIVQTNPFVRLGPAESQAISLAARRYGKFLELPIRLV